ncbi:hypothetical protein Gpo141_00010656 [Globisporangium polare]
MSELFALPTTVVEDEICQFLDAPSLARLSCTNRELHAEISRSQHWATHVARNFGIAVNKISSSSALASASSSSKLLLHPSKHTRDQVSSLSTAQQATISWRDVFLAAWMDSLSLATAMRDNDILQVYHRHPQVLLSQSESKIRDEIVLMQGLRRFPSSASLLSLYAQVIRQELVVRMVR